jgi:hypothetical protein
MKSSAAAAAAAGRPPWCRQVLTPWQEGQLEASSYPWCPDVWTIAGLTAAHAAMADKSSSSSRSSKAARKEQPAVVASMATSADGSPALGEGDDDDPLAALTMGTDVLQPLMPFMTAFQLLRAPTTVRGAGLRLKRESDACHY